MLSEREDLTSNIFLAILMLDLVEDLFKGTVGGDINEYIHKKLDPVVRRLNLPQKDKERIYHIFENIRRFDRKEGDHPSRSENFRKKIFFFETFMVYKMYAISVQDEKAIQQAMFWEIGPRSKPPEPHKVITVFPRKHYHRVNEAPESRRENTTHPVQEKKTDRSPSFRRKKRRPDRQTDGSERALGEG